MSKEIKMTNIETVKNASKILLISSKRLGDVIFTTPTLKLLREQKPSAQIDVLAFSTIAKQALSNNPHINKIMMANDHKITDIEKEYDVVLPMINNTSVSEYLAGSKKVILCERMAFKRHLKDYFNDFLISLIPELKDKPLGPYELYPSDEDRTFAKKLLTDQGVDLEKNPLVAIHMGANRTMRYGESFLKKIFRWKLSVKGSKCWPFNNFKQLVDEVHKTNPNVRFILTGAPSEAYLGGYLKRRSYVINLIGKTNVLQLGALLGFCKTIVTGDTGPLHVACAVNLPVLTLFANTDPAISGPHPERSENTVIYKKTMEAISVDEVKKTLSHYL
jgi:ADP-heptose:LPS heptosyltransferase